MNNLIIILFGIFIIVLLGLVFSYPTIKEVVYIRRTPKMDISALPADELTLVSGKAEQAATTSPSSQTKCLWCLNSQIRRAKMQLLKMIF